MIRLVLLLLITMASVTAFAEGDEPLWQAIEQLKMRIEQLEAKAGIAEEPKKAAPAEKPSSTASGKVYTRYWLSKNAALGDPSQNGLVEDRDNECPSFKNQFHS